MRHSHGVVICWPSIDPLAMWVPWCFASECACESIGSDVVGCTLRSCLNVMCHFGRKGVGGVGGYYPLYGYRRPARILMGNDLTFGEDQPRWSGMSTYNPSVKSWLELVVRFARIFHPTRRGLVPRGLPWGL